MIGKVVTLFLKFVFARTPFKRWRPSTRPAKDGKPPSVHWDIHPLTVLDSVDFTTYRRMSARVTLKYYKLADH